MSSSLESNRGRPQCRTFFVTRHPGAMEWAKWQGIAINRMVLHLDMDDIREDDIVIGTLPIHLAAEVCEKRARYFHLVLDLSADHRGVELSMSEMTHLGARLVEYEVSARSNFWPVARSENWSGKS